MTLDPDAYFLRAMRDAYRPLNAIEQAALLPLQVQWRQQGSEDRFWAGVPVLRDDGAAQILPLTVERVEPHAHRYWRHDANPLFTLSPSGEIVR